MGLRGALVVIVDTLAKAWVTARGPGSPRSESGRPHKYIRRVWHPEANGGKGKWRYYYKWEDFFHDYPAYAKDMRGLHYGKDFSDLHQSVKEAVEKSNVADKFNMPTHVEEQQKLTGGQSLGGLHHAFTQSEKFFKKQQLKVGAKRAINTINLVHGDDLDETNPVVARGGKNIVGLYEHSSTAGGKLSIITDTIEKFLASRKGTEEDLGDFWTKDNALAVVLTHEFGHHLFHSMSPEMQKMWHQAHNEAILRGEGFVSAYAEHNTGEDFADTYACMRVRPWLVAAVSPVKYEYMRTHLFDDENLPSAAEWEEKSAEEKKAYDFTLKRESETRQMVEDIRAGKVKGGDPRDYMKVRFDDDKFYQWTHPKSGVTVYWRHGKESIYSDKRFSTKGMYVEDGVCVTREQLGRMIGFKPTKVKTPKGDTKEVISYNLMVVSEKGRVEISKEDFLLHSGEPTYDFKLAEKQPWAHKAGGAVIYESENPDGTMTRAITDEKHNFVNPILSSLIGNDGTCKARGVAELQRAFLEQMGTQKWFMLSGGGATSALRERGLVRMIGLRHDGAGQPVVVGDYYRNVVNGLRAKAGLEALPDTDLRADHLINEDNSSPFVQKIKRQKGDKIPLEEGNRCMYRQLERHKVTLKSGKTTIKETWSAPRVGTISSHDYAHNTTWIQNDDGSVVEVPRNKLSPITKVAPWKPLDHEIMVLKEGSRYVVMPSAKDTATHHTALSTIQGVHYASDQSEEAGHPIFLTDMAGLDQMRRKIGGFAMDTDVASDFEDWTRTQAANKTALTTGISPAEIQTPGEHGAPAQPKIPGLRETHATTGRQIALAEHQVDAAKKMVDLDGRVLLCHFMGTGKTFTSMAGFLKMKQLGKAKKVLIVAPENVVNQFAQECHDFDEGATIFGTGSAKPVHSVADTETPHFFNVVGYSYFTQNHPHFVEAFRQGHYDSVVCDEAHNLKSMGKTSATEAGDAQVKGASQRFEAVHKLNLAGARNFVAMTGTPITDTLKDLRALAHLVTNGKVDLGDEKTFAKQFLIRDPITKRPVGCKNGPRLAAIFAPFTHVVRSQDAHGVVLPRVYLDGETHQALLAGKQLARYRSYMNALSDDELNKVKEAENLGHDEWGLLSPDGRKKVGVARSVLQLHCYKPQSNDPFVMVPTGKMFGTGVDAGKAEMEPAKYPTHYPTYWPSPNHKLFGVYSEHVAPKMLGITPEEYATSYAGTKNTTNPGSPIKHDLAGKKVANPDYVGAGGPPGIYDFLSGRTPEGNYPFYLWNERARALYRKDEPDKLITDSSPEREHIDKCLTTGNAKTDAMGHAIQNIWHGDHENRRQVVVFANHILTGTEPIQAKLRLMGVKNAGNVIADIAAGKNVGDVQSTTGRYYTTYIGGQLHGGDAARAFHDAMFKRDAEDNPVIIKKMDTGTLNDNEASALHYYGIKTRKTQDGHAVDMPEEQLRRIKDVMRNVSVVVATEAAEVGLNWGNAHSLIMYDSLFTPADEAQRIARVARLKSELPGTPAQRAYDKIISMFDSTEKELYMLGEGKTHVTSNDVINHIMAHKLTQEERDALQRAKFSANVYRLTTAEPSVEDEGVITPTLGESSIISQSRAKQNAYEQFLTDLVHSTRHGVEDTSTPAYITARDIAELSSSKAVNEPKQPKPVQEEPEEGEPQKNTWVPTSERPKRVVKKRAPIVIERSKPGVPATLTPSEGVAQPPVVEKSSAHLRRTVAVISSSKFLLQKSGSSRIVVVR